jgi:hypothetical protein
MSEQRVVVLENWEPSYERRELSLTDPETLSEAIRSMGDQESTTLTIEAERGSLEGGGRALIVGASKGAFTATALLGRDDFYDLVGDPAATGKVLIKLGGQEAPFPRRLLVSVEQAEAAALEFFRAATVDVEGGSWEPQSSAWSS